MHVVAIMKCMLTEMINEMHRNIRVSVNPARFLPDKIAVAALGAVEAKAERSDFLAHVVARSASDNGPCAAVRVITSRAALHTEGDVAHCKGVPIGEQAQLAL